ncbi:hypothetical protein LMG29739_02393 [Paraburkholderia solisilvae]|uniref:Uncharacterized protein n=1 Tax=Paraburkholderia solisilvae TaxID=624376 RepID=A0A6J5DSD7_9BURK|nr:hypothetical protein LMG29739_02393 [Paraburkholderia solisilvae]
MRHIPRVTMNRDYQWFGKSGRGGFLERILHRVVVRRQEWLARRYNGCEGSDVYAAREVFAMAEQHSGAQRIVVVVLI